MIEYDKTEKDSWLEKFWLQKAYLEWREPSLINVNWWCEFIDHSQQPKDLLVKVPPKGVISSFQVSRAAGLITGLLNFCDMLDKGIYPAETIRKTPICMNQYKNIFGTTRIPGEITDTLVHQYPTTAKHIIVMINNQMFKLDVKTDSGERVPVAEIERLLLATSREALSTKPEPAIGLLTAGHRDTNFKGYDALKKLSAKNSANFELIKEALFVVCLDDSSTKDKAKTHHRIFYGDKAENRWFDKCIQLIVANNGKAGINGEHSPCDAVVPGKVIDYIVESEPVADPGDSVQTKLDYPKKLIWEVNEKIIGLIAEAQETAVALINDTESCLLQTDIYGYRYIKEVAKAGPDAYVQMALQLAYYRMYKEPTAVYESASTRFFKHGRTETGRSMSSDSLEFIKAYDNDNIAVTLKLTSTQIN